MDSSVKKALTPTDRHVEASNNFPRPQSDRSERSFSTTCHALGSSLTLADQMLLKRRDILSGLRAKPNQIGLKEETNPAPKHAYARRPLCPTCSETTRGETQPSLRNVFAQMPRLPWRIVLVHRDPFVQSTLRVLAQAAMGQARAPESQITIERLTTEGIGFPCSITYLSPEDCVRLTTCAARLCAASLLERSSKSDGTGHGAPVPIHFSKVLTNSSWVSGGFVLPSPFG